MSVIRIVVTRGEEMGNGSQLYSDAGNSVSTGEHAVG